MSEEKVLEVVKDNSLAYAEELEDLAQRAVEYFDNSLSYNTRRNYAAAWNRFKAWTSERSIPWSWDNLEPALALYITHLAENGNRYASITQLCCVVKLLCRREKVHCPTEDLKIQTLLKGIRRSHKGLDSKRKTPLSLDNLKSMVRLCPPTLLGKREKATMLLGFVGAFRRSELVAIKCEHITVIKGGISVFLPFSKTDQEGKGRSVIIPRGKNPEFCPVQALTDWLRASGIQEGYIFRKAYKGGKLAPKHITAEMVSLGIKKYAKALGLDAFHYGGHSLRAGFVTEAAKKGAANWKIMQTTGHKSVQTLQGYVRVDEDLKNNPAQDFDL